MEIKLLHGKGCTLEIDRKFYRPGKTKHYKKHGVEHSEYTGFEPFNPNKHQEALSEVAEILKTTIPPKKVIEELFKKYTAEELQLLAKKLKKGEVIAKRHDGCLGITFINKKKKKSVYHQIIN